MSGIQDLAARLQSDLAEQRAAREDEPPKLTKSDLTTRLAEIKRLAGLAAQIAPDKKRDTKPLTRKDGEMILDLLRRITRQAAVLIDALATAAELHETETEKAAAYQLNAVDQDVVSALVNLGCGAGDADAAVRAARVSDGGAGLDFQALFIRSMAMSRR